MPGNLNPANPAFTMPYSLATAFEAVAFMDAQVNEYADGRSTRRALAINPRYSFRITRPLTDQQLDDLRGFYFANERMIARGAPFYFYNVRETTPVYSWDDTGSDPVGRYVVVWEGGWNETLGFGLNQSSFVLRQVA